MSFGIQPPCFPEFYEKEIIVKYTILNIPTLFITYISNLAIYSSEIARVCI